MKLSSDELMQALPHDLPFVMLDRVDELEPGVRGKAVKSVTVNDPVMPGHFPGGPLLPPTVILESMAQLAGLVALYDPEEGGGRPGVLAAVQDARFPEEVRPGDLLVLTCVVQREMSGVFHCACVGEVDGRVVAEAALIVKRARR